MIKHFMHLFMKRRFVCIICSLYKRQEFYIRDSLKTKITYYFKRVINHGTHEFQGYVLELSGIVP